MRSLPLRAASLACVVVLTACGGGGDNDDHWHDRGPVPNPAPNPSTSSCSPTGLAASAVSQYSTVCMLTSSGEIVLELYRGYAPATVDNFLRYVADGFYSNTLIHRVDRDFVMQGGGYTSGQVERRATYGPIPLESNNGLSNLRGSIAMARGGDPNSATSQFFINAKDNTSLDYKSSAAGQQGYAVFGRVISGMTTVDAINTLPVYVYNDVDIRPRTEVLVYWVQRLK
jgi:peptidyl-prolyl cis-trans isomerase A (cyclophilin A)